MALFRARAFTAGATLLLTSFLWATAFTVAAQDYVSPEASTGRYRQVGGEAKSFMVVAANPHASAAGVEILKAGGSAADAAVAVQTVLNMVEPQSSGLGGGSFIVYWDNKTKTISTYDGREMAPAAATERRFLTKEGRTMDRNAAVVGGHSIGVPGTLRVLELAQRKHGKLKWDALFRPAIKIADDGFALSPRLFGMLSGDSALASMEPAKSFFYQPDGGPKPVGTIIKNPEFAKVLRTVAEKGADAFYDGKIAEDIVRAATGAVRPSDMTRADLKNYKAVERPPVCRHYRDKNVCSMGPPTSGGIGILQTLGLLERFDLKAMGATSPNAHHVIIEAGRLVFADRAVYIADPDVLPVPTAALLSPAYIDERAGLINLNSRMKEAPAGKLPDKAAQNWVPADSPERISTSHFSIVDAEGNALAMTTSIEGGFGSHVMVDGFMLNNTLTDFSYGDVAQGKTVANAVGPSKRPRSSMAPTLVFDRDGKLEMVVGSPGGPAIVGFVSATLVAMIDWDMPPQEAISAPHVLGFGRGVQLEPEMAEMKPALEKLGHEVRLGEFPSGIHGIRVTKNGLLGGADPRREGAVMGQ